MFEIGEVFHVSHVVDDLDAAMAFYRDVFGAREWQRTSQGGVALGFTIVGDVVFMPMEPVRGTPVAPARFLERHGPRLHSLALYVDDPVDLVAHLRSKGLRLTGSAGGELADPRDEIWTHPRELPIPLELFEPREATGDPRRNDPGWAPASVRWRDEHPLGLAGAAYVVVTADRAAATARLVEVLGASVLQEGVETPHGTVADVVGLGRRVVVEVAQPVDGAGRAARDLAAGASFHAVTLQVADLDRAVAHLSAQGIGVEQPAPGHAVADPADTLGVLFQLTDRDPRR
jgi:catechol 2,3-dioxygenase-like lactoylglutathione lyase family enzyme